MENSSELWKEAARLHLSGKVQEACGIYDKLLFYQPDNPQLLAALGSGMAQLQTFGLAAFLLKRAIDLKPEFSDAWHNLAIAYRTMGEVEEAAKCYQKELSLPGITQEAASHIYANWSGCYVNEGNPEKAVEIADIGLRFNPTLPQLHNHRSLALLEMGRYQEGFAEYEARMRLPEFTRRDYGTCIPWDGKKTGKLAIHGEQGLGDEILFLTLLKKVIPLADDIAVECSPRLYGLLRSSFAAEPKIRFFQSHDLLTKDFKPDAWCAMGSLCHLLWPFEKHTYLRPSRTYFRTERPRLGISWRGGTLRTHEYHRNAPFELWKNFVTRAKAKDIDVISVQYGPAKEMAKVLDIPHDEANIQDLDTLAAMLKSCDLVVSVCNTSIHMCGAMGVPCVVLVPAKPAWRYGLKGERSDWYESVSYIRQGVEEDWASVLARATKYVEGWANADYGRNARVERATASG